MPIDFTQLFALPEKIKLLDFLNSQGLATFMSAIVALLLAKYGAKTAEAITENTVAQEGLSVKQEALKLEKQESADLPPSTAESSEPTSYRDAARGLVQDARTYIDDVVKKDPDLRHHRTYDYIGRYDYIARAVALMERSQLSEKQRDAAVTIFTAWKPYAKGRAANKPVPKSAHDVIKEGLANLKSPISTS